METMTVAVMNKIDEARLAETFEKAAKRLDMAGGEMVLDFSSVRRVDANALRAMEGFLALADEKSVKVLLRGVNVDVYKVLKLVKLASRFTCVN
jgi:anti-anti-sigma regulatory factor